MSKKLFKKHMLEILDIVTDAQRAIYELCGLEVSSFVPELEGSEYYAHSCCLNRKNIKFRIAKKTPTKSGLFVTIWKRGEDSIISPYDESDPVDFVVVAILNNNVVGQFIFPKSVLLSNKIFSINANGGKRAIRVYSPWDDVSSAQAVKTKKWQAQYFVDLTLKNNACIEKIKSLYSM